MGCEVGLPYRLPPDSVNCIGLCIIRCPSLTSLTSTRSQQNDVASWGRAALYRLDAYADGIRFGEIERKRHHAVWRSQWLEHSDAGSPRINNALDLKFTVRRDGWHISHKQ